jgi:hypothetical protein
MPKPAERKIAMKSICPVKHSENKSLCEGCCNSNGLTLSELIDIALYTVQKINNYPESLGKTVENYFHLLFFDEVKAYLTARVINNSPPMKVGSECSQNNKWSARTKQLNEIRSLCKLLVEQQEDILRHISYKLDGLEANLSESNTCGEEN